MLQFTINEFKENLKAGYFPRNYRITTQQIEGFHLIEVLSLFYYDRYMITFIEKISKNASIEIENKNKAVRLGKMERFLIAYVNSRHHLPLIGRKHRAILEYFRSFYWNEYQLKYIFNTASVDNLIQIMQDNYFRKSRLIYFFNQIENCRCSSQKLLVMYHLLNPYRQWAAPITPILDMYYYSKRIGHVLGLSGRVTVTMNGEERLFPLEGACAENSFKTLIQFINMYSAKFVSPLWSQISEIFSRYHSLMIPGWHTYKANAYQTVLKDYQENKFVVFPVSWHGHTVGFGAYGNLVICSNRGEGRDRLFGCKVFKVKEPQHIPEMFKSMLGENPLKNVKQFYACLEKVVDLKKSVLCFKSKHQKYGTCTLVNPKSLLDACIVLLQAGVNASTNALKRIAKKESGREKYKHMTRFMREAEIEELIKNMFYANSYDLISFYAEITKKIVAKYRGMKIKSSKDQEDLERVLFFIERIPNNIKAVLNIDEHLIKDISKINKKTDKSAIVWSYQRHVTNGQETSTHKINLRKGYIVSIDDVETPKLLFSYSNAKQLVDTHNATNKNYDRTRSNLPGKLYS